MGLLAGEVAGERAEGDESFVVREPGNRQGVLEAAQPLAYRTHVALTADQGDAAVAVGDQIVGRVRTPV